VSGARVSMVVVNVTGVRTLPVRSATVSVRVCRPSASGPNLPPGQVGISVPSSQHVYASGTSPGSRLAKSWKDA
jgi:hypothetical protein